MTFKRRNLWWPGISGVLLVCGCAFEKPVAKPIPIVCKVRFEMGQTLVYEFASQREVTIQWERQAQNQDQESHSTESLILEMAYTPVEVTEQGTVLKVTCRSAKAERIGLDGLKKRAQDAAEHCQGKSFHLTVDSRGRIVERQELIDLIQDLGKLPFRQDARNGRIKSPEMIADLWATQWFLWDAQASMETSGALIGDSWQSRLSIPTPMVMRKARDVTYTLTEVKTDDQTRVATITHQSVPSTEKAPRDWPIPYSGTFKMSGPFGFLRGYKIESLTGAGQERFDLDRGLSLGYEQSYDLTLRAMVPPGLWATPTVIIQQTITQTPLLD